MATSKRSTTTRDQHRKLIARGKPPCHLCEQPIDYTLPHLDPMSFEVDHVIPLGPNPSPERIAALDTLENKAASHRKCNRDKWDRVDGERVSQPVRTFVTSRTW